MLFAKHNEEIEQARFRCRHRQRCNTSTGFYPRCRHHAIQQRQHASNNKNNSPKRSQGLLRGSGGSIVSPALPSGNVDRFLGGLDDILGVCHNLFSLHLCRFRLLHGRLSLRNHNVTVRFVYPGFVWFLNRWKNMKISSRRGPPKACGGQTYVSSSTSTSASQEQRNTNSLSSPGTHQESRPRRTNETAAGGHIHFAKHLLLLVPQEHHNHITQPTRRTTEPQRTCHVLIESPGTCRPLPPRRATAAQHPQAPL